MNDERTTAYLLNELTEREAEQFEEDCFAQPVWPDAELDYAEQQLIDAYLKNELSYERRRRFEENYLITAARKKRVEVTRAFLWVVCPNRRWWHRLLAVLRSLLREPGFLVPRFAAIMVTVGLAATLLWFAIPRRAPQKFANISLAMRSDDRGSSSTIQKVKLPLPEDALRISLTLPEPATAGTTYRVRWEDARGPIDDLEIEKQDTNSISVIIPADELKLGRYVLILFQKDPNGTEQRLPGNYRFDVE